MRYIENAELREWIKETLRKNIFQKAHALAVQTGCDILVKLEDSEDDNGSQYYATRTLEDAFSGCGLQKKSQDLSVSGDTGLPISPLVDRGIQSSHDAPASSDGTGVSAVDVVNQKLSGTELRSDRVIPMQLTAVEDVLRNIKTEPVETTLDNLQNATHDATIDQHVDTKISMADDEPPDPGVVDGGGEDGMETQQTNTDEIPFSYTVNSNVAGTGRLCQVPMSPKPYQCAVCHKAFRGVQVLQKHYQTFHMRPQSASPLSRRGRGRGRGRVSPLGASQPQPKYLCTVCFKVCSSPRQLEDHVLQCHMDSTSEQNFQQENNIGNSLSPGASTLLAENIPFPPLDSLEQSPVNSQHLDNTQGPSTSGSSHITPGSVMILKKSQTSDGSPVFISDPLRKLSTSSRMGSSSNQGTPPRLVDKELKKAGCSTKPQVRATVTMHNVNQSVVRTPDGELALDEGVKLALYSFATNPNAVARRLAGKLFTTQERVTSNCAGSNGKDQLDPIRMHLLKCTVFEVCGITPIEQEYKWKLIKLAVDSSNRSQRYHRKQATTMDEVSKSVFKLPDGTLLLDAELKETLVEFISDPYHIGRLLADRIFTADERIRGNCNGNMGLSHLNVHRLELLKSTVFEMCSVNYQDQRSVWHKVKQAVDASSRKLRFKHKSPHYHQRSRRQQAMTMDEVSNTVFELPDGTLHLDANYKETLVEFLSDPYHISRLLADRMFTVDERIRGNCNGNNGLFQLDLDRLELLKSTVFEMCSVSERDEDKVWQKVKQSVDASSRKLRFKYK